MLSTVVNGKDSLLAAHFSSPVQYFKDNASGSVFVQTYVLDVAQFNGSTTKVCACTCIHSCSIPSVHPAPAFGWRLLAPYNNSA